jgi:hypothetical protein
MRDLNLLIEELDTKVTCENILAHSSVSQSLFRIPSKSVKATVVLIECSGGTGKKLSALLNLLKPIFVSFAFRTVGRT